MLDSAGLRMMELAGKGYCCSQIIVQLALEEMDKENPDLLRAASGLCNGMGSAVIPCGILLGAASVAGMYAGKGSDFEEAAPNFPLLLEALHTWFSSQTAQYGGITCQQILGEQCSQPDPVTCGELLSATNNFLRTLLTENGFDITEGRDAS